jgi:hypothetical protein
MVPCIGDVSLRLSAVLSFVMLLRTFLYAARPFGSSHCSTP